MKPILVVTLQGEVRPDYKREMAKGWSKAFENKYHVIVMDGGQHKSVKVLSGRTIKLKKKFIDKHFKE